MRRLQLLLLLLAAALAIPTPHPDSKLQDLEAHKDGTNNAKISGKLLGKDARQQLEKSTAKIRKNTAVAVEDVKKVEMKRLGKAAAVGALGGVVAGYVGGTVADVQKPEAGILSNTLVGGFAGLFADFMIQHKIKNMGQDARAGSYEGLGRTLGIGAVIGGVSYAAHNPENHNLFARVCAGMGGALAASFVGNSKAEFRGDGTVNYAEFISAFGGREDISADELAMFTEQPEPTAARFLNKVGTLNGKSAEDGARASIIQICMFLDTDDTGSLTAEELVPMFGSLVQAQRFIAHMDASEGISQEHVLLQAHERVGKDIFFEWVAKYTHKDICKNIAQCEIDAVSLSMISQPDLHVDTTSSLSEQDARQLIVSIKRYLRSVEFLVSSPEGKLSFTELWRYLQCPNCEVGSSPPTSDTLGKNELLALTKNNLQARKLLLAILDSQYDSLTDYERTEKKLKRKFEILNPLEAFIQDVGERMYEKHKLDEAKILLKTKQEED